MATPTLRYVKPTGNEPTHLEPEPVIIHDLPTGGGVGFDADTGIGREILQVDGSTDLATVPDFAKHTYVDVRGEATSTGPTITLPKAEAFGEGRVLYIIDKLGHVDGESWLTRIRVEPDPEDGIDGSTAYTITEKNGFVGLRATNHGPLARREWQVIATNPPNHHSSNGFGNWEINPMELNKGYISTWMGAHVYAPLMMQIYDTYASNKFWVRYYPTAAMAAADKDRAFGTEPPDTIHVSAEFVVGGDAPARSYGDNRVVSSWDADGRTPINRRFAVVMQVSGTPSRSSFWTSYKDMVTLTN